MAKSFSAKYRGICADCGADIEPGDRIGRWPTGGYVHAACPTADTEPRGWWGRGEYPLADQVYDARGGAASDYEWYGEGS